MEIANIGPREIRKRQALGMVALICAALLGFLLVGYQAPRIARLVLFAPLWIAGLGLFQARQKT